MMDTSAFLGYGTDLLIDVAANFVFWIGLAVLVHLLGLRNARNRFLKFFGLKENRKLVVYLSNLWLPDIKRDPWGRIVSGDELRVTKTISELFGSPPLLLPEFVRGLVDSFWIGKKVDVTVDVDPRDDQFKPDCNMIVVGATTKNSIRRKFVNAGLVWVTIAGEPTETPTTQEILKNPLEPKFIVMRGERKGQILHEVGNYALAIVERINDPDNKVVVFMCTGIRGDSSWAAVEYLKRNWRELFDRFGEKDFAQCLWFDATEKPMKVYKKPARIERVLDPS